jgi:hypothetical protein
LAKLFGKRWHDLTQLRISGDSIEVSFAAQPAASFHVHETPPESLPLAKPDKPLLESQTFNDADLALDPPAGMLQPLPPLEEPN